MPIIYFIFVPRHRTVGVNDICHHVRTWYDIDRNSNLRHQECSLISNLLLKMPISHSVWVIIYSSNYRSAWSPTPPSYNNICIQYQLIIAHHRSSLSVRIDIDCNTLRIVHDNLTWSSLPRYLRHLNITKTESLVLECIRIRGLSGDFKIAYTCFRSVFWTFISVLVIHSTFQWWRCI